MVDLQHAATMQQSQQQSIEQKFGCFCTEVVFKVEVD
jgi:hypothetical protein